MNLATAMAFAAMLLQAPQGDRRPPHHWHGEFPDFNNPTTQADLKIVIEDVDLAAFGQGATIWCRPTVGCTLKVAITEKGAKGPFDSIQVAVPLANTTSGSPESAGKWLPWKLLSPGESKALPHQASVELLF